VKTIERTVAVMTARLDTVGLLIADLRLLRRKTKSVKRVCLGYFSPRLLE
jgi:hypothetical protein